LCGKEKISVGPRGFSSCVGDFIGDFLWKFLGDFLRDFLRDFHTEALTSLQEALKIRIADFKGCVLLPLLLLLFEKPSLQ
jgi:hypothetical protein